MRPDAADLSLVELQHHGAAAIRRPDRAELRLDRLPGPFERVDGRRSNERRRTAAHPLRHRLGHRHLAGHRDRRPGRPCLPAVPGLPDLHAGDELERLPDPRLQRHEPRPIGDRQCASERRDHGRQHRHVREPDLGQRRAVGAAEHVGHNQPRDPSLPPERRHHELGALHFRSRFLRRDGAPHRFRDLPDHPVEAVHVGCCSRSRPCSSFCSCSA